MKNVGVFGVGRVGLPLSLVLADNGANVIGVDVDEKKLEYIRSGKMPFLEKGAQEVLERCINKNFTLTTDVSHAVKNSNDLILTLGTPVDEHMNPIFSQINNVMEGIIPYLDEGHLIALRSTVSPGTTEYLKIFLERHTRFEVGRDIFLAFCPERIAEGYAIEEIPQIPQIVGALDEKSLKRAGELFKTITKEILETDAKSAEIAKLYSNMYRYIDFAMANEFMMIAQQFGRDIHHITDLVNHGYKRKGLKLPGFAAGPCLYKDGFFLVNKTPYNELISTAWKINETMPAYLIEEIGKLTDLKNAKVALLGMTFKKDIDDTRRSLSFKAKKIFVSYGADVYTHDPYTDPGDLEGKLKDANVIMLAVNHELYAKSLSLEKITGLANKPFVMCDVWNMFGKGIVYKM